MAAREAEEEAEKIRQAELEKEKEKTKGGKKKEGKKGKSRSPSPKKSKGKDSVTSGTPPPGENTLFNCYLIEKYACKSLSIVVLDIANKNHR